MKRLWNIVNEADTKKEWKTRLFLMLTMWFGGLIGCILWIAVGRIFLPATDMFLCFVGYPAFFMGPLGGAIYLYRHAFN